MAIMLLGEQFIISVAVKGNNAEITTIIKMPDEIQQKMTENIKKCVPEIVDIQYLEKKQETKEQE